jgi:hypothetical protein
MFENYEGLNEIATEEREELENIDNDSEEDDDTDTLENFSSGVDDSWS